MSSSPRNSFDVHEIGDVVVVRFKKGRCLELPTTCQLDEELSSLANDLGQRHILFDFVNISHLSSIGLGRMFVVRKKLLTIGIRLSLCRVASPILEVLQSFSLNKLFPIVPYPDSEEDLGGATCPRAPDPGKGPALKASKSYDPPAP